MRTEHDFLGTREIPDDALYGIHSVRATENFPDSTPFHKEWFTGVGLVKRACYRTYRNFKKAALEGHVPDGFSFLSDEVIDALEQSAVEITQGKHFEHFIVPAVQGGAGTSINLAVNEIIANRALNILGHSLGNYSIIDPIEQANIYQSTNDVIPTSLKVTVIQLLNKLETQINATRLETERIEKEQSNTLRVGYTQMMEAVPSSYGRLFSTYSDALSRDWWRVSKCFERIKVVNIGGGAIGTGMAIPRFFIMNVVQELQALTRLPITRGENLQDATNNLDALVEVHAILKAHAVNLEKMVSDIRLLSSDIASQKDISIPQKQVGSSIMPGKVNPVIPEFVISTAHKVYANDMVISSLCAQGCIDLNAYLPVIGHAIIDSLKLLIASNTTLSENLLKGLIFHDEVAKSKFLYSASTTTVLIPFIGYHKAAELAREMKASGSNILEANAKLKLVDENILKTALEPQNLLKLGFSIKEL